MNIDELKIGELKLLQGLLAGEACNQSHWKVGGSYFVRAITYHYVGKLVSVNKHEIVLEQVSWVADSGRFYDALKTGDLSEVEPYPSGQVIIGRGAIVDASIWNHDLPTEQK